jgi:competence protein ComGC
MGRKNNSGLTLVELIIIVVILSILILLAIMYFRGQIFKGNDAKRKADIDRIKIAAEEYEKDHNCYPSPSLMSCNPGYGLKPYLDKIPCDPMTHASYMYVYQDSVCPGWFKVYANLENKTDASVTNGAGPNNSYNYVNGSPNAPGEGPTPPPSGGGGGGSVSEFFGCKGGVCVPISWDSSRPGPECDPNYQNSTCYNQCGGDISNECTPWR